MKRVLVVAKAYPPVTGGVETYSEQIARAYLRQGIEPTVLTQIPAFRGWGERDYPEGKIRIYSVGPGNQAVSGLRLWMAARRVACTHFSFAHSTTWRPSLALWGLKRKVKRVLTVHGREVLNFPALARPLMERSLRTSTVVASVSGATQALAVRAASTTKHIRGTWVVAHNGLSYPEVARNAREKEPTVGREVQLLTIARLVPRKNVASCLHALHAAQARGLTNFRYRIAGRGPQFSELQQLVEELGLGDRVEMLGYVPEEEIPSLYEWADVFLHPQTNVGEGHDFEGFGLVIADAMSFGCAVVAGRNGGPEDFVFHGENGLLVDGLDQSDVDQAVEVLVSDDLTRLRMGHRAKQVALETLSWDRHVATILRALDSEAIGK